MVGFIEGFLVGFVVSPSGGWDWMGLVWLFVAEIGLRGMFPLRMGSGVDTLQIVLLSWDRTSTWRVSGEKLESGL